MDYLLKINKVQSAAVAAYLSGFGNMKSVITRTYTELMIFTHTKEETENAARLLQNYIDENDEVIVTNLTDIDRELYTAEISFRKEKEYGTDNSTNI